MADIADTLKGILGDNAEDKIKNVMDSLSGGDNSGNMNINPPMDGLGELMQLRSLIEGMTMNHSDPRSNLLLALRPYMREGRQQSVDSAVRLMGVARLISMLGNNKGGGKNV